MKPFLFSLILMTSLVSMLSASEATNKAIALRVFDEVLTKGDFELAKKLYAPNFVNHGRTRDVSLSVDQAAAKGWLVAFPDLVIAPEIVVAEGDLVAILWRATGTNKGAANGIPATGRRINERGITIWRIENGRITEEWSEFGQLLLMQQLGLVPGGAAAPEASKNSSEIVLAATDVDSRERESNRAIVKSVFEQIVGAGKLDLFENLYATSFANHGLTRDGGVDAEIEATRGMRALAPDLEVNVTLSVAEGDLVAVVYSARGTNTGAAMGLPATGRKAHLRGMSIMRVRHGKITDEWSVLDQYQTLEQLGLIPSTAGK